MSAFSTEDATAVESVTLSAETEYRFEVADGEKATVTLVEGTAEVFGTELGMSVAYEFGAGFKGAVFTWHGCLLEVRGRLHMAYTSSEDTPMTQYLNTHAALEELRQRAERLAGEAAGASGESVDEGADADDAGEDGAGVGAVRGPVLLIAGPTDSGKSTLARILSNYATRQGRRPLLVDLDVGQNGLAIPGTVAMVSVERPSDVVTGEAVAFSPTVFFHGYTTPSTRPESYRNAMQNLANAVEAFFAEDADARHSGVIINTCGWIEDLGYQMLLDAVRLFSVDIVTVLGGSDRFPVQLQKDLGEDAATSDVHVLRLPKSGGVVERPKEYRRVSRGRAVRKYFYGPRGTLTPASRVLFFRDIEVFTLGTTLHVPLSALPIGAQADMDPLKPHPVTPSQSLVQQVLAISYAASVEELPYANVAGYLYVTEVNVNQASMRVLAPSNDTLPGKYLLMGNVQWSADQ